MATEAANRGEAQPASSMYELFMGLMTVLSLVVMVLILVVKSPEVDAVLTGADTLFCVIFLFDFGLSVRRAPNKRAYVLGPRPGRSLPQGLIDLLGSIPSIGVFRAFRLFRFARVARIVRAKGSAALAKEFVNRRAESAIYIIITAAMLVLLIGSSAIAFIEPGAEGSNIKNGGDAFWWAFVTITTVGYGDRFPVTEGGRFVGMLTMAVGIGIFGVLTSYLSSVFMAPDTQAEGSTDEAGVTSTGSAAAAGATDPIAAELAALRAELADLRAAVVSSTVKDAG